MKLRQMLIIFLLVTISTNGMAQVELIRKGQRPTPIDISNFEESEDRNPLIGFWTEYKRTENVKRNKEVEIDFSDTLKFKFMADSSLYRYYDMGKTILTDYGFVGNKFYYDTDETLYDFKMKDDNFSLSRTGINYYFVRVDKLYFPPIEKVVPNATTGKIGKLDNEFLQGKWKVYKKTDPKFDRKNVYLYKLEIGESIGTTIYEITAHFDNANTIVSNKGSVTIENKTIVLMVMDQSKTYNINMAANDEMILQDGEVVYYLKK